MSRSEQRIPKLRRRGRENRRKLLNEAKRLLHEHTGETLRFSEVFEAAGVSRGSAYRIYIGIDDLLQDLATEWVSNFVEFLQGSQPEPRPDNWMQLSDFLVQRGARYWMDTADTMRLLPRLRSNTPSSYPAALEALADCLAGIFQRYFELPAATDWPSKMAFFAQLCDVTFTAGIREHGRITSQRTHEAEVLCRAYLALHMPSWLAPRT